MNQENHGCQQGQCAHNSDCAVHNEPAMPAGECDCTAFLPEASPETKGQCNTESACSNCYSNQGESKA